jgi:two-component system, response regulator / RNA-binding antiterminator
VRILLLHATDHDIPALEQTLAAQGHDVLSVTANALTLTSEVDRWQPDLILIATDDPSRDMVEQVCVVSQHRERPIVLFTEADDAVAMKKAVKAGVAAYVVAGFKPERMNTVMDVAIERFTHEREQYAALAAATKREAQERIVTKAKALLRRKGLSESEAYAQLRTRAMRERCTIAEAAEHVLGMSPVAG